jgi:fibronectin type 3 domain-containing protein
MKKWSIFLLSVLIPVLVIGCLNDVEEVPLDTSGIDIAAPEALIARVSDGTVHLEWRSVADASTYRVYRAAVQPVNPTRIAETADTFYTDTDLINGRIYYYSVSAVTSEKLEGSRSESIAAVPSVYTILINGGNDLTNSRLVTLTLTGPASTALMRIGHEPDLSGAAWESFRAIRSWNLEDGDGLKTVYASFQDQSGTVSPVTSANIALDTYSGITGLSVEPTPALYNPGAAVHFVMNLENDETGGEAWLQFEGYPLQVPLYDDGNGGDEDSGDGTYEADYRFPLAVRGLDIVVTGYFIDEAGNRAQSYEMESQISFSDPPDPVTFFGASDSTASSITLRWEQSQDENFRSYRLYRDGSPGVDPDPALLVTSLSNIGLTEFTDNGLIEGKLYYYRIFVVNDLDEEAGSNERSASTFDAYPNPVLLDTLSAIGADRLTLTWSRNENTDFLEYQIYRSTSPGVTDDMANHVFTISDRTRTFYEDAGLDTQANDYYYRIYVFDTGGKASPSNEASTVQ